MAVLRRTKIVATLGPATDAPGVLERLIESGIDVVRLNFSHGKPEDHVRRAERVRALAAARGRTVGVLADLQGPKIRVGRFRDGKITLVEGARFVLDINHPQDGGTAERAGVTYPQLAEDVKPGVTLLLDDGRLALDVEEVVGGEVRCRVATGGVLANGKGINRKGGGLSAAALTDTDRANIRVAASIETDYLAVSFVRNAADVEEARALLRAAGGHAGIVAKIERAEAVVNIEEITRATDAVMVARGDLAVEIGDAAVPPIQKRIIRLTRKLNKTVITATQMMESMIESPLPTRAEVSDVANAVLDGTDAIMLSAETASGKYPVAAVEAMNRVCLVAEQQEEVVQSRHRVENIFGRVDEAIAMATMYTANHMPIRAIAALTESGSTPLWMSRISSNTPIYAMTRHIATCRKVTLYRGVYPVPFEINTSDHAQVNREALEELRRHGAVREGDMVIITKGDLTGVMGGTSAMKIAVVPSQS